MEALDQDQQSQTTELHNERLAGRSQQIFFTSEDTEILQQPDSFEVDFDKRAEFDASDIDSSAVNQKITTLMAEGHGTIAVEIPAPCIALALVFSIACIFPSKAAWVTSVVV